MKFNFPSYYRKGKKDKELLRFNCLLLAASTSKDDIIGYAQLIQHYILEGEWDKTYESSEIFEKFK